MRVIYKFQSSMNMRIGLRHQFRFNGTNTGTTTTIPPPPLDSHRVFDSLDFPCNFKMKVIGVMDDTFVDSIVKNISKVIPIPPSNTMDHSIVMKGKFASVTINPHFDNAKQIYDCYEVLKSDTRVKFVL